MNFEERLNAINSDVLECIENQIFDKFEHEDLDFFNDIYEEVEYQAECDLCEEICPEVYTVYDYSLCEACINRLQL